MDAQPKWNLHKTFKWYSGNHVNFLRTFNLVYVSTDKLGFFTIIYAVNLPLYSQTKIKDTLSESSLESVFFGVLFCKAAEPEPSKLLHTNRIFNLVEKENN